MDRRTPSTTPVDLDAFRVRRHAEIATEVAGRRLHAELYANADTDSGRTEPTPPRTVEEVAVLVHGIVGDSVDDLTFGRLVDAVYAATA